ncbi:hypothetical protein GGF31_002889 [Allomyces arbusculus]|nr:hypothetical protein GGF31_002889 [Allomyces arbusculus]
MPRSIEADAEAARRIQSLERTVEYLRTKHSESLQSLHEEIRGLQARCADLTWKSSFSSLPGDSALSLASADVDPSEPAFSPSTHPPAPPAPASAVRRTVTTGAAGTQTDTDVHVVSSAEHARQTAVQAQQNALLHDVLGKLQALTALQAETAAGYAGQVAQSAADFRATVADLHATIAARDRTIAALHAELDAARAAAAGTATAPPPPAVAAPSRSTSKSRMPTVKSILSRIGELTHAHHAPPAELHEGPRRAAGGAASPSVSLPAPPAAAAPVAPTAPPGPRGRTPRPSSAGIGARGRTLMRSTPLPFTETPGAPVVLAATTAGAAPGPRATSGAGGTAAGSVVTLNKAMTLPPIAPAPTNPAKS